MSLGYSSDLGRAKGFRAAWTAPTSETAHCNGSDLLQRRRNFMAQRKNKKINKWKWFLCFISMDNLNRYEFVSDIL